MKRYFLFLIILILMFLALTFKSVYGASRGLTEHINRHNARVPNAAVASRLPEMNLSSSFGKSALFDDSRLNSDDLAEHFRHQYSASVRISGNRLLTVWEDDRNGDLDIFGQIMNSDGNPGGANQSLIADNSFLSQTMLRLANSLQGEIAAIWVDEAGNINLQFFDSNFAELSTIITVNDNLHGNLTSYPSAEFLSDGRLVVAWEDTRDGSAIYGQIISASHNPLGTNFPIALPAEDRSVWSPQVAAGLNGQFAVCWEELSPTGSEILLLLFDFEAEPSGIPINVADLSAQSADQYDPAICSAQEGGYLVGWSDSRAADEGIYVQLLDNNGNKLGGNSLLSEGGGDQVFDLFLRSSAAGKILAVWSSYDVRAEIVAQQLDLAAVKIGANYTVSDLLAMGERFGPELAFRTDGGALVTFTDSREGNLQIYGQNLNTDLSLAGTNFKISSAANGAQQTAPIVARMASGDFGAVWVDQRQDAGDIYFQHCDQFGVKLGPNLKLNDDVGSAFQGEVSLGSADNGRAIAAWVDGGSSNGLTGVNLFAQLLNPSGSKIGVNFIVNDDPAGSGAVQADPDCDISASGQAVIVWRDARAGKQDIYCQIYNSDGNPSGGNFKVNDSDNPCFEPAVSMMINGMFVVGWREVIDQKSFIKLQAFDAAGNFSGGNRIIPIDTAANQQLAFDLAINPYVNVFVLAWINLNAKGETEIHGMLVGLDGLPQTEVQIISDFPDLGFADLRVDMDAYNDYAAVWSDMRTGVRRAYLGFVESGIIPHSVGLISRNSSPAREQEPSVAVNGRYLICVWSDNRNAGAGYDIYSNAELYNPTDVIDDGGQALPLTFNLAQNYPNPFNPNTIIPFALSQDASEVSLEILNILGQVVQRENWGNLKAGNYRYEFKAGDLCSGIYLYRLSSDRQVITRKMTLLK